tara:strand:- start:68 stop:349 length:282 start_codon:yes stop_codon:yes gene_type:complete
MKDEELRSAIESVIRHEIQDVINEYVDTKEAIDSTKGGIGFYDPDEGDEFKVKVKKDEVDKIIKEYKKIKKANKSNLAQVKKMGLVDKFGNPL